LISGIFFAHLFIRLRRVALPLSPSFAFDASKIRVSGVNIDQQQQSPLSTARIVWGSPAK
jgi:hypothetical protein